MKLFNRAAKSGAKGLYVSRPVLNAQEWQDWATKHGIPNPVSDLHVTVVYSQTDAKIPLATDPMVIATATDYWGVGRFGFLGPDNEALCFIFSSWSLQDRFYAYTCNGTTATYPDYVPHMTLSTDAKGFDLPDEALADCPEYIVLGGEVRSDIGQPDLSDEMIDDDEGVDDADDGVLIVVLASAKESAEQVLAKAKAREDGFRDIDPLQMSALLSIAHDKPLTKRASRRLAKAAWAPELLRKISEKTEARGLVPPSQRDEAKTKDVTIKVAQVSGEVAKNLGSAAGAKGYDEERRWVYGIANVSTIDGELVEDLDGDSFTTACLEEYCAKLLLSQAGGDFEHEGEAVNKIVGAIMLSADLQKSLGIDLGMEFLLTVTHVPDDADWEKVKKGEWMQSIAGVFYYED